MAAPIVDCHRQYVSVRQRSEIDFHFFHLLNIVYYAICSEMNITKEDRLNVVKKLCEPIMHLPPTDIPAMAYQIFSLCTTAALVVIPLYTFNRYFQRHYYKKAYDDIIETDQSNNESTGVWSTI